MNPYQVVGLIGCCVALFAGTVAFLTAQGVSLLVAFLCVYVAAIGCMLGMQRRARESCEGLENRRAEEGRSRPSESRPGRPEDIHPDTHIGDIADALCAPRERFRA